MAIRSVAIIGAGTMGGGIAIGCMAAGLKTLVIDTQQESLDRLKNRGQRYFDRLIEKEKITLAERESALGCLTVSTKLLEVQSADLIIEAVFEDLDVKQSLLRSIAEFISADSIVATNTSALKVSDMSDSLPYPERFLGLHYFSPAEHNPLVELVAGSETDDDVLRIAQEFLVSTGKTVLPCKDSNGFAVNRFFCPYTNEAVRILDDGLATTGQIDQIAQEVFDLAVGPFAVMNIVKPSINLNAVSNLSSLGAFYSPAVGLREIGEAGNSWQIEDDAAPLPQKTADKIAQRLMAAVFLPVLDAISEDVAAPIAFDLGATNALRFGNPPIALMRSLGRSEVTDILAPLLEKYDHPLPNSALARVFDEMPLGSE